MPDLYTIDKKNFFDLLARCASKASVYVPYRKGARLDLAPFDEARSSSIEIAGIRPSQPIKTFLSRPRKELSGVDFKNEIFLVGAKQCDLASLVVQDHVFIATDPADPFYVKNREKLVIIAADCSDIPETCFCTAMDGAPYPRDRFDISLSNIGGRFLVEVGSLRGRKLVAEFTTFFAAAEKTDLAKRDEARAKAAQMVRSFVAGRGTPGTKEIEGAVAKNYTSLIWKDFYATCVECGACNLACPTCHCFLLFDGKRDDRPVRFMEWDACLYKRFAHVAGGGNARKHLWERLRNRFEKKFDFLPKTINTYGCTGCGRCIEACPGDIDIREVLKGLVKGAWNKPPNT